MTNWDWEAGLNLIATAHSITVLADLGGEGESCAPGVDSLLSASAVDAVFVNLL